MDRSFQLERGKIDLETGRFPLVLLTNGEASDGHIVDVRGLETPDRAPMFVNHNADPVTRMGGIVDFRKSGKSTRLGGASLHGIGVIDMEGDSALADIRRDIAQGISVGDVTAMSGRWSEIESTPRANLAKSHYAYREGLDSYTVPMFFAKARVDEGSIVGIGADTEALIGRSQDLTKPEHVRSFYSVLIAGDAMLRIEAMTQALERATNTQRALSVVPDDLDDDLGDEIPDLTVRVSDPAQYESDELENERLEDDEEAARANAATPKTEGAGATSPPDSVPDVISTAGLSRAAAAEYAAHLAELDRQSDAELDAAQRDLLYRLKGIVQ